MGIYHQIHLCTSLPPMSYHVQPKEVNGVTASCPRELNDKLSAIGIGGIFPFRSDALLEEVIVGVGFELIYLGQVVKRTTKVRKQ